MGCQENYLTSLRVQHAELSGKIEEAERSPGCCRLKIQEMKKQKLRLKEDICRLDGTIQPNAPVHMKDKAPAVTADIVPFGSKDSTPAQPDVLVSSTGQMGDEVAASQQMVASAG